MNELIGLISVRNYNYGSILQAFAFQKILFEKEINNEIIFYEKKNDIKQLLRIFNYPLLKAKLNTVKRGLYCKKDKEVGMVMSARNSSFSKFVEKELVFSKKYIGRDELVSGAKKYKAFVLGSDQVWNPMNLGSDFYTMSFCPKGILKVTYASSFGVSQIPKYQRKRTVEYLSNIDEISVREDSGAKIVRNLTGREVPVVVDPTLLLDAQDWGRLIQDERLDKEPYIFAYFVGSSPEHRKAVKRLAKATGLKVIGIPFVDELVQEDRFMINNVTGGEPFIRTDLDDIIYELYKKSDRIVISTNGFFTDRVVSLCKKYPQLGIRISIEGLEQINNEIRGLQNGYQRGYSTLKRLREMGMKDVGFGMTIQDKNASNLVSLYKISDKMGMEFATASLHNSFYFVEEKNIIHDRPMVAKNIESLVNELLRSDSPKKWFRAYFNHGLINYIYGQKRLLPCDMSFDTFFIDPYGDVMPCNGTKDKEVMGNLNSQAWDEIWNSSEADAVRAKVRCCDRNCWMIGSVSPAMHKYIWKPAVWVLIHKLKSLFGKNPYSMYENKICCDYRDGKVSKEELDKCSTCDMNCVINNGLSEASQEQLKHKTGEEIVNADIAEQMKG